MKILFLVLALVIVFVALVSRQSGYKKVSVWRMVMAMMMSANLAENNGPGKR